MFKAGTIAPCLPSPEEALARCGYQVISQGIAAAGAADEQALEEDIYHYPGPVSGYMIALAGNNSASLDDLGRNFRSKMAASPPKITPERVNLPGLSGTVAGTPICGASSIFSQAQPECNVKFRGRSIKVGR